MQTRRVTLADEIPVSMDVLPAHLNSFTVDAMALSKTVQGL
ncbi:hypothetical protein D934_08010 [Xylella fastidiosa subsp. sandyi Ann-1]|uniref:Uncharacterized protein n=1 Tax=Xylella fastidiosa subsp. sandyi Ann-1 TaxID=155920 RepID=A0A060H3I5_XYLFS|nr:hypothetical protein D934_08010 [Xylella fastidiosa subsp. sandyi Ann-1]KAF0570923.1 hypothetical protein P305_07260 [Xylella fastidiosa subsp. fastidiosa Mus-1]